MRTSEEQTEFPELCYDCGAPGEIIGKSYSSTVIYHCTECHGEWHSVLPSSFISGYVDCALWVGTTSEEEQGAMDSLSADDLPEATWLKLVKDALRFMREEEALLEQAYELYSSNPWGVEAQAGYDFWLTRNGHGAGFWDRGLGDVGIKLSEAARMWGTAHLYVGDDGLVHFMEG